MARNTEFYKGRRKKKNYAIVPIIAILAVITVLVVAFYAMQQYAVISDSGVKVELPILSTGETTVDSFGNEVKVFDKVDANIVYDNTDYTGVKATAGKNVEQMRAIFVPYTDVTPEKLTEYTSRLNLGNALVLEMKPRSGQLLWESQSEKAFSYGLSVPTQQTAQIPELIAGLKEKNIYLAAQISCCIDDFFASRSTVVALRTQMGVNYTDDSGYWLDPYSQEVREYIVELARELYDMGFDEVVLADVIHPVPNWKDSITFSYNREMSTTPTPSGGVCGMAMYVAQELSDRHGVLSIMCYSAKALASTMEDTGQDARLFMKLYDRVYLYTTDKWAYPYNVTDIEPYCTIGKVTDRLVPVVINYLPDNDTWVLVDDFDTGKKK